MAAPSASVTVTAKPDASAFVEPQQPVYMAPSALSKPDPEDVSNPQMPIAKPTAEFLDVAPPPHTLAKGKYEVQKATVWIVLALGTILALLYVLWRVRSYELEKKRARERLRALRPIGKLRA